MCYVDAVNGIILRAEGIHSLLCCRDGSGFSIGTGTPQLICPCPCGESRTPHHATLVPVLLDTARQWRRGMFFLFQRMVKCAINHVDQCF